MHRRDPVAQPITGFSVLYRRFTGGDALPALAVQAVERSNAARATRDLSPATAHRLPGNLPSWLLSTPESVCLLRAVPAPHQTGYGYALACLSPRQTREGLLAGASGALPQYPGLVLIDGVVPDGARNALVETGAGKPTPLPISANTYQAVVKAPKAVVFTVNRKRYTIRVPRAYAP
jgi:hypothetical protein